MLRFMGSQRVGHNWATELNWTYWIEINLKDFRNKLFSLMIIYANNPFSFSFTNRALIISPGHTSTQLETMLARWWWVCVLSHVLLCDPVDCSPPGSSVCSVFPAILEWVAISFLQKLVKLLCNSELSYIWLMYNKMGAGMMNETL